MRTIKLTQGKEALVDDEDYEFLNQWNWTVSTWGYSISQKHGEPTKWMHKLLCKGKFVDHIDGNKLNNQKSNLRSCTKSQNNYNRGPTKANTSGYKGVFSKDGRWQAKIRAEGKQYVLGTFRTREEAAAAYDQAARELHGEFAYQNLEGTLRRCL